MSEQKLQRKVLRISLLGDTTVGKTSLIDAYFNIEFQEHTIANIGIDKQQKEMKMKDGKTMKIILWDTAGQERFHDLAMNTIRTCQGIALCFDFSKKKSFEGIPDWLDQIIKIDNKIPIILFGNKCDLIDTRVVEEEEAKSLANRYNIEYLETSAKENINVQEGFQKIIDEAYEKSGAAALGVELEAQKKEKKKGFC